MPLYLVERVNPGEEERKVKLVKIINSPAN